jgi:rhodanese-related sulfurtransferase
MKIKSAQDLVKEAMDKIKTVSVDELRKILDGDSNALLIDIRDIRELKKTGKIKVARHMPRGMLEFWLDPQSPYYKKDITTDRTKILYCASNWRSALATKAIQDMGFDNVCHVKGGFQAIVDAGFEVEQVE